VVLTALAVTAAAPPPGKAGQVRRPIWVNPRKVGTTLRSAILGPGRRRSARQPAAASLQLGRSGLRLRRESKWFQSGSMNITVKNVPDRIYRVMKREAKRKRRSLNAEIIKALETESAEAQRRRRLMNLRKELDRFAASLPPLDDSAPLIRRDRER
jgi:hypothetical protein